MSLYRIVFAALVALVLLSAPASAARAIVDLHKLDAYFALFASNSNVPWKPTTVRLDTYSSAPVDFSVYHVDPGDVLTAGSNARPRVIDTRALHPMMTFHYTPPGGYQFQSNVVDVPLGSREGFFVVEARRGDVGEQVWINRTRVGLLTKETPGEIVLYGTDLGTGRALARMRVQFVVRGAFVTRASDAHGIVRWNRDPRPVFALAQWGESYAFVSLLPQVPLPASVVGVRTDTAVVHAGDMVRVIGFARTRNAGGFRVAHGVANLSLRLGGTQVTQTQATLDGAGAFSGALTVPSNASAGDYAVLAQVGESVGGATVHVEANAGGLSLQATSLCDGVCDARKPVPVGIVASQGGVALHVRVVRSPHVFIGYTPSARPWATTEWFTADVRADANGHASIAIPPPSDGLPSTYGIDVSSGGATATTRVVVPTASVAVRLRLDRAQQTLGTPVSFEVFVGDIASEKPLVGQPVTVQLVHGNATQSQTVMLDENGRARGTFASPSLGSNLLFASVRVNGAQATDADEVQVVPQATQENSDFGSADAHVVLDKTVYRSGDDIRLGATLDGAQGDALLSIDGALGAQTAVAGANAGRANAQLKASDTFGDLRAGAAFVRDGAIEWTSVPLALDAPGRPSLDALVLDHASYAPSTTAVLTLGDPHESAGTVVVRCSRALPSGSAAFDSAPALLAVGLAATQVSAPSGQTWHPWVDSTGDHAQVLGFERRTQAPPDLALAEADTQVVAWNVVRIHDGTIAVQVPSVRGVYVLSVLKMSDDGRVSAASANVNVQ